MLRITEVFLKYEQVQLRQVKLGLITLGRAFDFLV